MNSMLAPPKPMFDIDMEEYGWVKNVKNKKLALKIWAKRWNRLFDKSIEDFNWLDWKLTCVEQRCYMMYAALRWPELLVDIPFNPYADEKIRAGEMVVVINADEPGWENLRDRMQEAIYNFNRKIK